MNFSYLREIKEGNINLDSYLCFRVDNFLGGIDEYGNKFNRPHSRYWISFPKLTNGYGYDDYLNDFNEILIKHQHKKSESIIHILTLVFLNYRKKALSTEKAWSKFITSMMTKCNLHLEYPLWLKNENMETLYLQNYTFGKFDALAIKETIRQETNSDYWERYHKNTELDLSKCISFKRIHNKIAILDVVEFVNGRFGSAEEENIVCDIYFEAITEQYFKSFLADLEEELLVSLALGGGYFHHLLDQNISYGISSPIAIYTRIKNYSKNGWVIPIRQSLTSFNTSMKIKVPELNDILNSYYSSLTNTTSEFRQVTLIFVNFLGNGLKLFFEEKSDLAFINMWVALDTVLNRYTPKNDYRAIKNRVAALSCHQTNLSQDEQYNLVKKLYQDRSNYVHGGKPVPSESIIKLIDICQRILFVLINMNRKQQFEDITFKSWVLGVDRIWTSFYNNESVGCELLESLGIDIKLTKQA